MWHMKYEQLVAHHNYHLTINIVLESQHHSQLSKAYVQTVLINSHPRSQLSNYHPTLSHVCYPWSTSVLPNTNSTSAIRRTISKHHCYWKNQVVKKHGSLPMVNVWFNIIRPRSLFPKDTYV